MEIGIIKQAGHPKRKWPPIGWEMLMEHPPDIHAEPELPRLFQTILMYRQPTELLPVLGRS